MNHVEVHLIRLKPFEAGLAVLAQRRRLHMARADFGADDGSVPSTLQQLPQLALTRPVIVGLCRVEVSTVQLNGCADDRVRITLVLCSPVIVRSPAEAPRANAQHW